MFVKKACIYPTALWQADCLKFNLSITSASVMVPSVVYVARKYPSPWKYDISLYYWWARFELDRYVRSLRPALAGFFIKKWKSHIAAPWWITLGSHAILEAKESFRRWLNRNSRTSAISAIAQDALPFSQFRLPLSHENIETCWISEDGGSQGLFSRVHWHDPWSLTALSTYVDFCHRLCRSIGDRDCSWVRNTFQIWCRISNNVHSIPTSSVDCGGENYDGDYVCHKDLCETRSWKVLFWWPWQTGWRALDKQIGANKCCWLWFDVAYAKVISHILHQFMHHFFDSENKSSTLQYLLYDCLRYRHSLD